MESRTSARTVCEREPSGRCNRRGPSEPRWNASAPGVRAAVLPHAALLVILFGVLSAVWPMAGHAVPFIPSSRSQVLEQVPAAAATRSLEPLRRRLADRPDDIRAALALAGAYLEIGQRTADPRFISYVLATLSPWMVRPDTPEPVLVLQAAALQHLHRFQDARALLDRALAMVPDDAQARLIQATVLEVQGNYAEARSACRRLVRVADQLIAIACLTSIDSRTGRLESSYHLLRQVFADDSRLPRAVRVWVWTQLGEMAERLGDVRAAEIDFRAGLQIEPEDLYLKSVFADLLLRQGRAHDVVELLKANEAQDNLLLRLAIAGRRLGSSEGTRWAETFEARIDAARRDQDFTHLREQARFLLEVRHDAPAALRLAEQNWTVQREPADIRILLAAAQAAQRREPVARVSEWIAQTQYEDQVLRAAVGTATEPPVR